MREGAGDAGRDHSGREAVDGSRCPVSGDTALPLYRDAEPSWRHLRERHGGIVPVEVAPGVSGWLLLGYKENLRVLRDQEYFSADPRRWDPSGARPARTGALARDGDDHQRLRLPIVEALASVGTPRLVPVVERAAVHLLGRIAAEGGADLIGRYAAPLPALVLNALFGLPDEYGHLLADLGERRWSGDPARAEPAALAVRAYFRGLVARKRADPGTDLTSTLLAHPHRLTDDEAVEALSLLWESGHEPTTHLIGNALLTLLDDPVVWTAYLGGTLTPEDFVDHIMWTDPPLRVLAGRYPTTDLRFAGATIRRGEPLLFGFAAAHTDPSVARVADDTLALAGNRAHLSWGAGAHRCPATAFVREFVRTAIDMAVDRLRGMVLSVEPEELRRRPSLTVHGLVELPVWFTPTGERGPSEEPGEPEGGTTVTRWVRRRRKRAPAPRGARYQAPLGRGEPAEDTMDATGRGAAPARSASRPRRSVPGAGARYQAPFAGQAHVPDPLEELLRTWRPR
ncbi:cytochrome P450 [Nocardiopsis sp. MG754419]|uniref:cytochrome P450 n=1 Tax=Nocardiopsis sp. MG754419 TaxID=2259865 RepID=UPI001BA90B89|nr:cytochrome P450 [Nocardiopsis sp. MG754419]MBR8742999.1 cytochrome P450 [Nocardiopsis sp. MG754419]